MKTSVKIIDTYKKDEFKTKIFDNTVGDIFKGDKKEQFNKKISDEINHFNCEIYGPFADLIYFLKFGLTKCENCGLEVSVDGFNMNKFFFIIIPGNHKSGRSF